MITFPFMYGVMFGDIGHGTLLLIFGLYTCTLTPKISNGRDLNAMISAKYLITLMGIFAVFCGLIYNDFLSVPLNLFGSCWKLDGKPRETCTYIFGMDPAWNLADNKLT